MLRLVTTMLSLITTMLRLVTTMLSLITTLLRLITTLLSLVPTLPRLIPTLPRLVPTLPSLWPRLFSRSHHASRATRVPYLLVQLDPSEGVIQLKPSVVILGQYVTKLKHISSSVVVPNEIALLVELVHVHVFRMTSPVLMSKLTW
jgi:hypothetical protein